MRIVSVFSFFFSIASLASAQQPQPTLPMTPSNSVTPSADEVARRAMDTLGGGAWEHARYFSFTYRVVANGKVLSSFPQQWDRTTGWYHISGPRPDGVPFEATLNINTRKGHGSIQGRRVDDSELQPLLELALRHFANDTYWLLMPMKMFDPGVHRTYDGPRTDSCGHAWDIVKLTFDPGAGFTPGDVYWAWVNRDTGIVEEWDMKLQNMKPEDPAMQVMFHDYRRIAGLLISVRREIGGINQVVRLDDLQILPDVPKGVFGE